MDDEITGNDAEPNSLVLSKSRLILGTALLVQFMVVIFCHVTSVLLRQKTGLAAFTGFPLPNMTDFLMNHSEWCYLLPCLSTVVGYVALSKSRDGLVPLFVSCASVIMSTFLFLLYCFAYLAPFVRCDHSGAAL